MTTNAKRIARRATALLVAVALVLPATALAATGPAWTGPQATGDCEPAIDRTTTRTSTRIASEASPGSASGEAAGTQNRLSTQRKEQIKQRVRDRIRERAMRFDRSTEILYERIERLEQIAARVEGAGGEVGTVRALLAEARALIEESLELEAQAKELFEAIVDADDPRAAFYEARDTAIAAVKALRDARAKVREAAVTLAEVIAGLLDVE